MDDNSVVSTDGEEKLQQYEARIAELEKQIADAQGRVQAKDVYINDLKEFMLNQEFDSIFQSIGVNTHKGNQ
jgi:predicted  nucleic acid-binding Zn-ribbon protein